MILYIDFNRYFIVLSFCFDLSVQNGYFNFIFRLYFPMTSCRLSHAAGPSWCDLDHCGILQNHNFSAIQNTGRQVYQITEPNIFTAYCIWNSKHETMTSKQKMLRLSLAAACGGSFALGSAKSTNAGLFSSRARLTLKENLFNLA